MQTHLPEISIQLAERLLDFELIHSLSCSCFVVIFKRGQPSLKERAVASAQAARS
jgi:hypothetical protein